MSRCSGVENWTAEQCVSALVHAQFEPLTDKEQLCILARLGLLTFRASKSVAPFFIRGNGTYRVVVSMERLAG